MLEVKKSPKVADVYGWKWARYDHKDGELKAAVLSRRVGYKLLEPNHYMDMEPPSHPDVNGPKITTSMVQYRRHRTKVGMYTPRATPRPGLVMSTNHGFHVFRSLRQAIGDRPVGVRGQVLARVRIWGEVIAADRGWIAENMEFVELYSYATHSQRRAMQRRLGWPFPIKDFKPLFKREATRIERTNTLNFVRSMVRRQRAQALREKEQKE